MTQHPRSLPAGHLKTRGNEKRRKKYAFCRTQLYSISISFIETILPHRQIIADNQILISNNSSEIEFCVLLLEADTAMILTVLKASLFPNQLYICKFNQENNCTSSSFIVNFKSTRLSPCLKQVVSPKTRKYQL